MSDARLPSKNDVARDLAAGLVVFLVALPLCLGIALASKAPALAENLNVPLFSGLLAGIVGGILVGLLSGSHTSVSGPAAGLTAVVAAQLVTLGSFEAFLLAVVVAGVIQIGMGLLKAGFLAAFFPTSVVKGLLAAIGVILILKQIPHVVGHDTDPEGDMAFQQPDQENTFSEFRALLDDFHLGAAAIGLSSILLLVLWDKIKVLKNTKIPGPVVVVAFGLIVGWLFSRQGGGWAIGASHLVQVPVAESFSDFLGFLRSPDFSQWANPAVYVAGFTLAIVASLETLLNLQAVDKLDPQQRHSPASRELLAQGVGNLTVGLIGGLPITSVVVRGSVNVMAGARTKISAIFHGVLLMVCVTLLPVYLNMIPLSCLAAILLVTGIKLASPALVKQMWNQGRYQFAPFIITLVAIVVTDLLIGVVIGLGVSLAFILNSNLRRPLRRVVERHIGGEVLRIELANQVSFLNRAVLEKNLRDVPRGGHVLIDASNTDYIDPDVLDLLRDFKEEVAPAHGVQVSLRGFRSKYQLEDEIQFVDYSTRDLQDEITPSQVLHLLLDGNERFRTGQRLSHDLDRKLNYTAKGQHPLAVVLSCIDSRAPVELIFDLGLGDVFSIRVAGNVTSRKVLGSMEYACAVAGARLVLVLGHTHCGAVTAAVDLSCSTATPEQATGCQHLGPIVQEITGAIDMNTCQRVQRYAPEAKSEFVDSVARSNVLRAVQQITEQSRTISTLVRTGRIAVVGAMYDVATGQVELVSDEAEPKPWTGPKAPTKRPEPSLV